MKIRPLIIDETFRNQIQVLVDYAENNPLSMDDLLDTYNKEMNPIGEAKEFVLITEYGYRIVYSIEMQPAGKIRHLSISVNEDGKLPNEFAVREIMNLIGFNNKLEKCIVKLEDISPTHQAVNVLEIV